MSDDDPMGTVTLQLAALPGGTVTQQWFPVETCPGCSNATGQIKLAITRVGGATSSARVERL